MNPLFSWYGKQLINPKTRWWVLLGTLVYLLSPFDLAPDIIPVVGQVDDVVLLMLLVSGVSQLFSQQAASPNEPTTMNNGAASDHQAQEAIDVDAVEVP